MKVVKLGMILLGAAAMTGCGVSLQPFFTAANLYDDPALEGRWSGEDSTWFIKHTGFAQYTITTCDDNAQACTETNADTVATLFQVNGVSFLDFQEKADNGLSDAIRPHGVFQFRAVWERGMEISVLDAGRLGAEARRQGLQLEHLFIENRFLLTASPAQLQSFLAGHSSDSRYFVEWQRLERN